MDTEKRSNRSRFGIRNIRFAGCESGSIKSLPGFRKGLHTVPERYTESADQFVGKVSAPALEEEAEAFFQQARQVLGYKRREITLTTEPPLALLQTPDFALETSYRLDPDEPTCFLCERVLTRADLAFLATPESETLFLNLFDRLEIELEKALSVEALIDAIEDEPEKGIQVNYPSDCSSCSLRFSGLAFELVATSHRLTIRLPQGGSPPMLIDAYEHLRGFLDETPAAAEAFNITC